MIERSISHWGIHPADAETPAAHRCFSVRDTAYLRNLDHEDLRKECVAIHYGAAPRRNADGSTTLSLNYPLLIVSLYAQDGRQVAERVAAILNAHWDEVTHG